MGSQLKYFYYWTSLFSARLKCFRFKNQSQFIVRAVVKFVRLGKKHCLGKVDREMLLGNLVGCQALFKTPNVQYKKFYLLFVR
jgi:hypothetical protein